mgnify:CR=1 FL=1
METLIAIAKTKIWASHRHNSVSGSVALNPSIDVDKTISVAAPGLSAKGKCRSLTHRLSPDTGEAFTALRHSLAGRAPSRPQVLGDSYFRGPGPTTMHIDEVERVWEAIAARDDWTPLEEKIAAVRRLEALSLTEALAPEQVRRYAQRATGEKFLIKPN